jgi:hypothetical protein
MINNFQDYINLKILIIKYLIVDIKIIKTKNKIIKSK